MSENKEIGSPQDDNYEKDKGNYDVADYYDTPVWYKRFFIWLWPTICIWLFITLVAAPEYRLVSSLGYGAVVLGFQVLAWIMQICWPITTKSN